MNFDKIIDRRGSNCSKWDRMEEFYGVPASDGIAMWVADMDFKSPKCVLDVVQGMHDHGIFGYYGVDTAYRESIIWWMNHRHQWDIEPEWIFTTQGLVNGLAICLDIYTDHGDSIILLTPVYHAFSRVINATSRKVVECELVNKDNEYTLDMAAYDAQMTGNEKMIVLSSPHNPGGRVWSQTELQNIADFAIRHDLIIISDEIHHDLVFSGYKHKPMAHIEGIKNRLITMTAASKTFNIAGTKCGNLIVEDEALREPLSHYFKMHFMEPNSFGVNMVQAAYSVEGADWVDHLVEYLSQNIKVFDEGINSIKGLRSMPLQSTYLAWVDFSGVGMDRSEYQQRVEKDARIAASHGATFGAGGENFLRFNLGLPKSMIEETISRLQQAFQT